MTEAGTFSPVSARSALHLASLLDLSTRAAEYDSAEPILNAALLSVMGRLKVLRACVLRPHNGQYESVITKGVPAISLPLFELTEPTFAEEVESAEPLTAAGIHWLIPLNHQGDVTAVLCLGKTLDSVEGDPDVRTYVDLMRSILSIAVHNVETMLSLRHSTIEVERGALLVRSLYEFARDFTGTKDSKAILRLLSLRLMGQLMTTNFAIILDDNFGMEQVIINRKESMPLQDLHPDVLSLKQPQLTSAMSDDDPLKGLFERLDVGMAVPMVLRGNPVGVLAVCRKLNAKEYTHEELQFLEAAATIVITALDNERLDKDRAERQRLENELDIAADIQAGLLPLQLPPTPGLDVAADTRSSRQIGGDYYDVIRLDEQQTLLAIADVAGKGVPAALLMANVQAALNVLARLRLPLTQIVEHVNRLVYENTPPEVFVTLFLAVIDTATGTLEYVNAGHNPPILLRGDDVVLLQDGGVLTGVILDPPPYRLGVGGVRSGDVLVLYTDGVTETFNKVGLEYGIESLVECIRTNRESTPSSILQAIQFAIHAFSDGAHLTDDTSLVVVKVQ